MLNTLPRKSDCEKVYIPYLRVVNGVAFSPREIDIISCLVSGLTINDTAVVLSISSGAVLHSIEGINKKINSFTSDSVVNFATKTGRLLQYKRYFNDFLSKGESEYSAENENSINQLKSTTRLKKTLHIKVGDFLALLGLLLFVISLVIIGIFYFKNKNIENEPKFNHAITQPKLKVKKRTIDIKRNTLISTIKQHFDIENPVNIVVLTGPSGAGKTYISRYFALENKEGLRWVINAKSSDTITNSFIELAHSLAQTKLDKKKLTYILNERLFSVRRSLLIKFVRNKMSQIKSWFLVYDDVPELEIIKDTLPHFSGEIEKGRILVVMKNNNQDRQSIISLGLNTKLVKEKTIFVGGLKVDEQFDLFDKILNRKEMDTGKKFKYASFLSKIPIYALDTVIVANYIKNVQCDFDSYIRSLSEERVFEALKKNYLKHFPSYSGERFNIIGLSLNKIISKHPEYKELLLFISLLNAEGIPKNLLKSYTKQFIVYNFIEELQNFFSVVVEKKDGEQINLNIHEDIQEVIRGYIMRNIPLKQREKILNKIARVFSDYIELTLEKKNNNAIENIKGHAKSFLKYNLPLSSDALASMSSQLGYLNYVEGDFLNAAFYLERGVNLYQSSSIKNSAATANALMLLAHTYKKMGRYNEAKECLEKSYHIYQGNYTDDQQKVALCLSYLGQIYRFLGEYNQAKTCLEKSYKILNELHGENYIGTAQILVELGKIYQDLGLYNKAIYLGEKGYILLKEKYGLNTVKTIEALVTLGNIYSQAGKYDIAEEYLRQGIAFYNNYFGKKHPHTVRVHIFLANLLRKIGKYSEAHQYFDERNLAVYHCNQALKKAWVLYSLGCLYLADKRLESAEIFLNDALLIWRTHKHPKEVDSLIALFDLYIVRAQLKYKKNQESALEKKDICYEDCKKADDYFKRASQLVDRYFVRDSAYFDVLQQKKKILHIFIPADMVE